MPLTVQQITTFQIKILSWYIENKRDLPWREIPFDPIAKQRDPYKILVSEVMSQQTQLSRVVPKYEEWLKRFPTVQSLAEAPIRDVLLQWSGLGYNSRALRLQQTVKKIHESRFKKHDSIGGNFPRTYNELIKLPGIGEYTANALLCFAFNEHVAVVDTNVRKVILTELGQNHPERAKRVEGSQEISKKDSSPAQQNQNDKNVLTEKEIKEIAKQLLPRDKVLRLRSGRSLKATAYEWNQALMDYAATVLKKEKIAIPKQSAFKTSNRYYRGQTVKLLVQTDKISVTDLWQYFQEKNPIEKEKLKGIISQMEKEGLLIYSHGNLTLLG